MKALYLAMLFNFLIHPVSSFAYQFSHEPIDVVMPCHEKDCLTLDASIDSIRQYGKNINRIIVVSDRPLTSKAEWFDEKKFPFSKYDLALEIFGGNHQRANEFIHSPRTRIGWIFKQIMNLYALFVIPNLSSNMLVVDADTIFLKPVEFQNASGAGIYNVGTEYHMPYFEHGQRLIPGFRRVFPEHSGIAHYLLFQRPVMEDMFNVIRKTHGMEPWRAICRVIDHSQLYGSCIAEYELYFNFVFARTDQCTIRPLRFINTGRFDLLPYFASQGYDYVSCHHYLRDHRGVDVKAPYSIAFVHIGSSLPSYAKDALTQARLFNQDCPIYLLMSKHASLDSADQKAINEALIDVVWYEDLKQSAAHEEFLRNSTLGHHMNGFWRKATERFFYLDEFISQHNLERVFHFENDVMLYVDLHKLGDAFRLYQNLAAVFDNDTRCIPSIIYVARPQALTSLTNYFARKAGLGLNDMQIPALYKKEYGDMHINSLPIVPREYTHEHALQSSAGHKAENKNMYCNNIERFDSVFDAAALGQYLGGIDPIHGNNSKPGFINESCIFNPAHFSYEWIADSHGRKVPYMIYKGSKYRINNLHIHSKNLQAFKS